MDSNHQYNGKTSQHETDQQKVQSLISVEQLRHLVHLLDQSDVSEVELKRAEEGTRLVLRKAKVQENGHQHEQPMLVPTSEEPMPEPVSTERKVVAPLVGIFHVWAKPKGGSLVAVGDRVKAGQLVATIQSLNLINEVESPVAGRVIEILVQEGQAVEYGQPLMVVDSKEEPK